MELDRLSMGEKIAGGASIALFIFMFFDWFTVEISGLPGSGGANAWDALDWIPILLVITIVAALAVVALRLLDTQYDVPPEGNAVVAILGGISFLLILFRIIDTPGPGGPVGDAVDVSPSFGIFISLIAAAGIAYGAYRAMQEEGGSFDELRDRFSGGGGLGGGGGRSGRQPQHAQQAPHPGHQPQPQPQPGQPVQPQPGGDPYDGAQPPQQQPPAEQPPAQPQYQPPPPPPPGQPSGGPPPPPPPRQG